ncbi:MAG: VOC family protein [Hyphomicrobiales bacterium]|nr:VOC family protein [Hyphomicrobiales bacterium]
MTAHLAAITAFRLTTARPEPLIQFYAGLGFAIGEPERISDDEIALLGLDHGGTRSPLHIGEQRVDLDCFNSPGRPYPEGATSADLHFQHLALVTDNAAFHWSRARDLGAIPISDSGPVTLPASEGGVTAVKFRDPEGHPLEFLQFPPHRVTWQGSGLLGIDHSAISVSDVEASRQFYSALGLSTRNRTDNRGPTQDALDGLSRADVEVVTMVPRQETPHLELLAYRTSRSRSAGRLEANDVAATRIVWRADCDALLRDRDEHLHLLRRGA